MRATTTCLFLVGCFAQAQTAYTPDLRTPQEREKIVCGTPIQIIDPKTPTKDVNWTELASKVDEALKQNECERAEAIKAQSDAEMFYIASQGGSSVVILEQAITHRRLARSEVSLLTHHHELLMLQKRQYQEYAFRCSNPPQHPNPGRFHSRADKERYYANLEQEKVRLQANCPDPAPAQ